MPEVPYKISDESEGEFYKGITDTLKDINENKIGGAYIGDVFHAPGDVLTLKLEENSGLFKNDDGELDINITADCISNTPSGNIAANTVQGALNELDNDKVQSGGILKTGLWKISNTTPTWDVWDRVSIWGVSDAAFFDIVGTYKMAPDGTPYTINIGYTPK